MAEEKNEEKKEEFVEGLNKKPLKISKNVIKSVKKIFGRKEKVEKKEETDK